MAELVDDEFAELDTTEEEFDVMAAAGEPVLIVTTRDERDFDDEGTPE